MFVDVLDLCDTIVQLGLHLLGAHNIAVLFVVCRWRFAKEPAPLASKEASGVEGFQNRVCRQEAVLSRNRLHLRNPRTDLGVLAAIRLDLGDL